VSPGGPGCKQAVAVGLLAAALALSWQFVVVQSVYAGNWTSWFCTTGGAQQPDVLAGEHIYAFAQNEGYDGQFYHYVAHDPLLGRGLQRYMDAPRLRYRRILVPGLAYVIAAGQDQFIDAALIGVNLLFIFAGTYWLARLACDYRRHPLWGLVFLAIPAVLVSLDRLTVDVALTALCAGFAVYVSEKRPAGLYLVLVLAPLARETGLLLTAAYCATLVFERHFKAAVFIATSAVPAIAWAAFIQRRTPAYHFAGWFTPIPLAAVVARMVHPIAYPFIPAVRWTAEILDECALAGVLLCCFLSIRLHAKLPRPFLIAGLIMTVTGLTLGPPFWVDVFAFGRYFSPLAVLVALQSFPTRSWVPLLPVALIDPRIGLQLGYKLFQIARALFT
jgi:hypothetical protein